MQTSARYQAVYEILCAVFEDQKPADMIIGAYIKQRRYIGAKDKRFIADTVWDIIRHRLRLSFEAGSGKPRDVLLCYLKDEDFDLICGGPYGLLAPDEAEKKKLKAIQSQDVCFLPEVEDECPKWLYDKFEDKALLRALNGKAGVDIRANFISPIALKKRLQAEGLFFSLTPYSPFGLRSEERINLNNCAAYQEGLFDIQDESCQTACVLMNVSAGEKIIDYCAGAGGKSLAIGAVLENEGLIYAHDVNWNRMDVIKERAERLGIKNIRLIKEIADNLYDCFIVDAPCSGSGTWRRTPDLKFRLTPEKLAELNVTQAEILETAYNHTKKGGRIVYMTCSVFKDENENIVQNFVEKHPDIYFVNHAKLWEDKIGAPYRSASADYIKFSPILTNTDGFFFCMLKKA